MSLRRYTVEVVRTERQTVEFTVDSQDVLGSDMHRRIAHAYADPNKWVTDPSNNISSLSQVELNDDVKPFHIDRDSTTDPSHNWDRSSGIEGYCSCGVWESTPEARLPCGNEIGDKPKIVCEGCDRTELKELALDRNWGRKFGPGDSVRWYCPDYAEGAHE